MDNIFTQLLGSSPRIKVLDFYLDNPSDPYSIQDLLSYVTISRASAYNIVNEFFRMGILKYIGTAGRARLYELNKNNPIAIALQNLDHECTVAGRPEDGED